jgi:transposase
VVRRGLVGFLVSAIPRLLAVAAMTKFAAYRLARLLRAQGYKVRVIKRRLGHQLFWFVQHEVPAR